MAPRSLTDAYRRLFGGATHESHAHITYTAHPPLGSSVLTILLLACRPPVVPPPAPVVPAGPVAPVPPAEQPWPPLLPPPPLSGDTDAIALQGLSRSRTVYKVDAATDVIANITPEQRPALATWLERDPRWRVTRIAETTIAVQRVKSGTDGWSVGWFGYHLRTPDAPTATAWRTSLRLEAWAESAEWAQSELVGTNAAGATPLVVQSWQARAPGWIGWTGAALVVQGDVAALEVHELARELTLANTAEALAQVPASLANAIARADAGGPLPNGEPSTAGPSVSLTARGEDALELRARVNPGAAGWTWLRVVSGQRAWEESTVTAATAERVGWSMNLSEGWYMQARIPTSAPLPADAILELWFLQDGSTTPALLWAQQP